MFRLLIIILLPLYTLAHPGIGIVQDSKGAIYYTDLMQVWRIDPDGHKKVAVPQVHTHELYIDSNDNLFGEHLWYNGEQADTWGNYVWRLSGNGVLDTLKGPSEGFLEDYSFVRDKEGNMYWVEQFTVARFKKKAPSGVITTLAEGRFRNVPWLYVTPQGVLYFTDSKSLYKVSPEGSISPVARNITRKRTGKTGAVPAHALFGIWADKTGNIYIADYSAQAVKRIQANGQIDYTVYSEASWGPTGGLFDSGGNLWLLEVSHTNKARVRRIPATEIGEQAKAPLAFSNYVLPVLAGMFLLVILLFIIRLVIKKRRPQAA